MKSYFAFFVSVLTFSSLLSQPPESFFSSENWLYQESSGMYVAGVLGNCETQHSNNLPPFLMVGQMDDGGYVFESILFQNIVDSEISSIKIGFNGSYMNYEFPAINSTGKGIFYPGIKINSNAEVSVKELIKLFKVNSNLSVELIGENVKEKCVFTLKGSTNALNLLPYK